MMKPAIVIIAYNREDSLSRLLMSIAKAKYPSEDITLVISIDKSDNTRVTELANEFEWKHGTKKVVCHDTNLGLKKHVLECSGLSSVYGSVIVLEDDLYVSPVFYEYAASALEFSAKDEKIAGVSLYNHLLNVHAREPFEAINDGYDNYYFQFASSWGQAFTKEQWQGFLEYMKINDGCDISKVTASGRKVPANVCGWGEKSWLKYYIHYMCEKDMYFLYPRASLSTNFSEAGEHKMGQAADLQVPLQYGSKAERGYDFSTLAESRAVYDAYFENCYVKELLTAEYGKPVQIDLYGKKSDEGYDENARLLITCRSKAYKIIRKYGRLLRPHEANITEQTEGEDFFLYDLSESGIAPQVEQTSKLLYNYRAFKAKYGLDIIKQRILDTIVH